MHVAEGTILVYADIACPWASLAIYRFHRARAKRGLDDRVLLDLHAFPLELFNELPTPKHFFDKEAAAIAVIEPDLGWTGWNERVERYPGTVLLALEAVQAAKRQSLAASEELDLALRQAFFAESRSIYLRSEILAIADGCPDVDASELADAIDDGVARRDVIRQKAAAESDRVQGSPHFFLPDGSDFHNPGVQMHWDKEKKDAVIDVDEPEVIEEMLERAAAVAPKGG